MTRLFGSIGRTAKALAVLLLVGTSANESFYKMRMHKSLIKQGMDKNLDLILNHVEDK